MEKTLSLQEKDYRITRRALLVVGILMLGIFAVIAHHLLAPHAMAPHAIELPLPPLPLNGTVNDVVDFNIPAGTTPQSAFILSEQGNVSVAFADDGSANVPHTTPEVKGRMCVLCAANKLLEGTDLQVMPTFDVGFVDIQLRTNSADAPIR
jgi:hypothetical protein